MLGKRRQVLKSKPTADVDIVRAKLRLVQEQLDHLRGGGAERGGGGGGGGRGRGGGGRDGGGGVGAGAVADESNAVCVGAADDGGDGEGGGVGVVDKGAFPACVTAGLAAELGRSNSSLHAFFYSFPTARGKTKIPLRC
jgi:hypothetical protein